MIPVRTVNAAMNWITNATFEKMPSTVSITSARSIAVTLGNADTTARCTRAEWSEFSARTAAT